MRRYLPAAVLTVLLLGPMAQGAGRLGIYLTFSARDQNRIYFRDLKEEEVALYLDEQPVEIRYFGYRKVPTAFAFIIENSPRTAQFARSMPQLGQNNIVDYVIYGLMEGVFPPLVEMGPVLLAEFYKEFSIVQNFTEDDYLLYDALVRMQPNWTGLDKENIPVARMLGRGVDLLRDRNERRKILVLFTAVIDRESYKNLEEYRQLLRHENIEVYVVSFARRFATGVGNTFEQRMNTYYFRNLVKETSGHFYISEELAYIDDVFVDLKSRLANSYTLGFYVEAGEEPTEHKVEIKSLRGKSDITHRPILIY
ncbi:MAG: hypothetical protein ACE1ZI_06820 [Acidobacteriota bacterium]